MFSFWGKSTKKDAVPKTIVDMRAHLTFLEKKVAYAEEQRDQQEALARSLVTTNKPKARQALAKKMQKEKEINQIMDQITNLEQQLSSIEFANMNKETLKYMKQGAGVMRSLNKDAGIESLDDTMDEIRDQMAVSEELSAAISQPLQQTDTAELEADLEELEQDVLNEKMTTTSPTPSTALPKVPTQKPTHEIIEEDEDEALRQLERDMEQGQYS